MSVLGDRYEYDVFFSYAWADKTGDELLRDWSRAVADAVSRRLRLRFNAGERPLTAYLDRDVSRSGGDLDVELKQAAERSAVFVALISPYYQSEYCQKEVDWFCDSVALNGEALVDRACLLKIQRINNGFWPERFNGIAGKPLLYKDLCDNNGEPIGISNFDFTKRLSGEDLAKLIDDIVLEVADKISNLERILKAQAEYAHTQTPPDKPLYFLEAEPKDQQRWAEYSKSLRGVPSIVLPAGMPKPATAISADADLKGCNGMLLLRTPSDDDFSQRIKSAYLHRRELFRPDSSVSWIPWVLLDEVESAPPEEAIYDIPRVRLEGEWVENVKQAMRC